MRIADVLRSKGTQVVTVTSATVVAEVLRLFAEHNLGALPVVDDGRLVGTVSRADLCRAVLYHG